MDRYTSNPVTVMAMRYDDSVSVADIINMVNAGDGSAKLAGDGEAIIIETLNGPTRLVPGDWLIQGVEGDYYPCKNTTFQVKYRPANDRAAVVVDMTKVAKAIHHLERAPGLLRQMYPSIRLDKVGVEEALAILRSLVHAAQDETPPTASSLGQGMPAARRE